MLKSASFYLMVIILSIGVLCLSYFILVNTLFADNILPNIKINSQDVSLLSEAELEIKVADVALKSLPEFLEVQIDNYTYQVATSTLDFELESFNVVNYGKGSNFFKVISEAVNALTGKVNVEVTYNADLETFLYNSPINFKSSKPSKLVDSKLECIKDNYNVEIDNHYLLSRINEGIKLGKVIIESNSLISNSDERIILEGCSKFFKEEYSIAENLKKYVSDLGEYLGMYIKEDKILWDYVSSDKENELLKLISDAAYVKAFEGDYEIRNNQIYLYSTYQTGYELNANQTRTNLRSLLNEPTGEFIVATLETKPKILDLNLEIIDFTKTLGEGKTRIDLVRNGAPNYIVAYTQYGLEEIDYHVIQPGEEFSYIDFIQPNNGVTKSGRPIAPGICNSTTTLFRAVLESGLAVTDRSYHAYYVPSYEWGYPYNIVDAAYFTDPDVDFKFKNDSEYPILLKVEFNRDDNFQYNTVKILSSSKQPEREVEITNWRIWDKFSNTNFKGSFDRIVKEKGNIVKQDYFYSHYL